MTSLDKLPKEFTGEGDQPCEGVREALRRGADARWMEGWVGSDGETTKEDRVVSFDRTAGDMWGIK